MNYQKVYEQLINRAIDRKSLNGYFERHHIVPKSLGGSDESNNIVSLTAREHFIAHVLLAKVHGGTLWYAVIRMKGSKNRYVNSRLYDYARKVWASEMSGENNVNKTNEARARVKKQMLGNQHGKGLIGLKRSPEFGKAVSERMKGVPKPWLSKSMKGNKNACKNKEGLL